MLLNKTNKESITIFLRKYLKSEKEVGQALFKLESSTVDSDLDFLVEFASYEAEGKVSYGFLNNFAKKLITLKLLKQ